MPIATPRNPLIAGLVAAVCLVGAAQASWLGGDDQASTGRTDFVRVAQGGCSAAAAQAAAESGGQVLSVQTAQRDGQVVCIVTVLVPARDGDRPRRRTITIPQ